MIKTQNNPSLDTLLRHAEFPSLGEIFRSWCRDARRKVAPREKDSFLASVCGHYDRVLGERADYRLWRMAVQPLHPSAASKLWGDPFAIAMNGLESPDSVVVWGVIPVLAGLVSSRRRDALFSPEQMMQVVDECDRRIFSGLAPLEGAESGCGLIKVQAMDAIQKVRYRRYGRMKLEEAGDYVERLTKYLQEADPRWEPGETVSFRKLQREHKAGASVVPYNSVQVRLRTQHAVFNVRGAVRSAIREVDERADPLLRQAALFAFTAWKMAHSFRINQLGRNERTLLLNPEQLLSDEMQALRRAAQAMRDAERYLFSAGMAHLLLRIIPDDLLDKPRFKNLGDGLAFAIRQAGLEVDARFHKRSQADPEKGQTPTPVCETTEDLTSVTSAVPQEVAQEVKACGETQAEGEPDAPPEITDPDDPSDAFSRRLTRHQKSDPRWQPIMRAYPTSSNPLESFLNDACGHRIGDLEAVEGAFSLALEYGQVENAAKLIQCFQPAKAHLIELAHGMKRALQVMPFGMNVGRHQEWQNILRRGWASLPKWEEIRPQDALVIHEVLLGRYLSIVSNAGRNGARLFTDKFYGQLSEIKVREAFDSNYYATTSGPGTVTRWKLQDFIREATGQEFGSPVCVSVVSLGDDQWSVLAAGRNDRWNYARVRIPNLLAAAREIRNTYGLWFRRVAGTNTRLPIPWGREFAELCSTLSRIVDQLDPHSRWLVLSVEPDIAMLPWQDLVSGLMRRGIIVSLVPSLGWAWFNYRRNLQHEPGLRFELSTAPDLKSLRGRIEENKRSLFDRNLSAAIVLGHGTWSEGGITSVITHEGRPLQLPDWISLAQHRLAIVHSCFGGGVKHQFLGDLGGLPGVALGISCRMFCAPVAEVAPDAAWALHHHFTRKGGPRTFGQRYLDALAEDPSVSLYNLYGFADEPVNYTAPVAGTYPGHASSHLVN